MLGLTLALGRDKWSAVSIRNAIRARIRGEIRIKMNDSVNVTDRRTGLHQAPIPGVWHRGPTSDAARWSSCLCHCGPQGRLSEEGLA